MTTTFPTLYKLTETGTIQTWDIRVERISAQGPGQDDHAAIITSWGQEGSYGQQTRETITEGKNAGKKNATTPVEQARKDAQSKWEKQQKARKYSTTREAALNGERSALVTGGVDPMLAHPREKRPKALVLPCDVQRKLDGHRCLTEVVVENGEVQSVRMWSRTRKPIDTLPHITEALTRHFQALADAGRISPQFRTWLDGELYHHLIEVPPEVAKKYKTPKEARFQYLGSLIKKAQPDSAKVQYHVYDTATNEMSWNERAARLLVWLAGAQLPVVLVETFRAFTEGDVSALEGRFVGEGYEGLMARNLAGLYVGKRTDDLLKVKRFQDAEFRVVRIASETRDVTTSKGQSTMYYARLYCSLPGWKGQGDEEHEFSTTLNAPQPVQKEVLGNVDAYVGRDLTVKHFGLTADNKPRFPKALRFREDL